MKNFKLLLIFIFTLGIGCKKNEVNFNKYNTGNINPEIFTPLGQAYINSRDIFKPDSSLIYDAQGNIKYLFPSDTFFHITADTLLNGVNLGKSASVFELGNIDIALEDQSVQTRLIDLNNRNTEPSKSYINSLDGTFAKFPGFNVTDLKVDTVIQNDQFTYIFVKKGTIYCEIQNQWPTKVSNMKISLLNLENNGMDQLIGTFNFLNVSPNASATDSIPIGDLKINSTLGTKIESIILDSSVGNVNINLNDASNLKLSFSTLRVSEGHAIIPKQSIPKRYSTIDLSKANSKELLKNVEFGKALIPVLISSTFVSGASLTLNLPDAKRDGSILAPIQVNVATGTTTTSVDLSNVKLDMGQLPSQPYNMLRLEIEGVLEPTNKKVFFSSTDQFRIQFDATESEFKYADGYLGSDTFEVFLKNLNISQLTDFLENLKIENPNMTLNVSNSFGVPSEVELLITARSKDGKSLKLNIQEMLPSYPTIPQRGVVKNDVFQINNSNSNLSDGLKLPAETFDIIARVIFNQDGFQGYTNHLVDNSVLVVSFGAEIPLEMSASKIAYNDTIDVYNTFNSIGIINEIECKLLTENLFPFDAVLNLYFADANFSPIDSNMSVQLVKSASIDANGTPLLPSTTESVFLLKKSTLENFKNRQPRHIIVKASLSTTDNGTKPVRILEKCYLKTSVGIRTILNTTL